jgi:hypothetical protein
MPKQLIEVSGYTEIRKYLKEGPVFVKIAQEPFVGKPPVVVRNVRKSHGFLQVETLEGWTAGPFEIFYIEREVKE